MHYSPNPLRYQNNSFRRCGKSGLLLPTISLGLWQNFGDLDCFNNQKKIIHHAFDRGITHFDLANNYGPPAGSAETNWGRILSGDLGRYRDELLISTKAGYYMWEGPYGEWGSKKQLVSSLDQSLKRMKLTYVDIFYSHRPDPETPLEETMSALDLLVRQGKALYVGLSNYSAEQTLKAVQILRELNTPVVLHQPRYSMFDRWVENGLLNVLDDLGLGCIPFSPLAQGLLTNKYMDGIPSDSRVTRNYFLKSEHVTDEIIQKVVALNKIAESRGQTMAQMAIAWVLKDTRITSVLIGASKADQITDCLAALNNLSFSEEELQKINAILENNTRI